MDFDLRGLSVLAVHAHPDDESITTGGTLAALARRGATVTVVTCTLGEQGEVIGEPYAELVAERADQLGGYRLGELQRALKHLGVNGCFLGAAGRYRDSGMVGAASASDPRAFVNAGDRAVADLAALFAQLRPQLVITYGPDGGYGHPDHIQAHRITHEAARQVPVQRIMWTVTERAALHRGLAAITQHPEGWRRADETLAAVDTVDSVYELSEIELTAKAEAMRAHATQLWLADGSVSEANPHAAYAQADPIDAPYVFALSNLIAQPIVRTEAYQFGAGRALPDNSTDLLAGLTW